MKLCETEIVTFTDGHRSRFCARGTLTEADGALRVSYRDEGDLVTLTVRGGEVCMLREGTLSAVFSEGERTAMRFLAAHGEVPLTTETLRVRRTHLGVCIHLRYKLHFREGAQAFLLKVTVRIISEEG